MTDSWRRFEFGVGSIDGYRERFRFPHPVETYRRGTHRFGVQEYRRLRNHMKFTPSAAVADFHTVAVACFLADKHYLRSETPDGWTRRFHLTIPVIDPAPWNGRAGALLEKALAFLTSDRWRLEFQPGRRSHVHAQPQLSDTEAEPPRAVSLFSAGLDSFCYNVIAAAAETKPRFLVGHSVPHQLVGMQKRLSKRLPGSGHTLAQFKVEPHRIRPWNEQRLELTQRTRTLLFMSTALLLCESEGAPVLEVPENGLLAVNPPLNATRVGACSTRSVHPMTMHLVNGVLDELATGLRVENPVADLTKGELCEQAANVLGPEGLSSLAATVSCSSMMPGRRRSTQKAPNCGWCYPCLVRHASLEFAGGDRSRYEIPDGPARGMPRNGNDSNRKALRYWLQAPFGRAEMLAAGPFPASTDIDGLLNVIRRSRSELLQAFN
jgi:7-cyano-7-deazaguanine synthase in queuosine biosynthesis